MRHLGLAAVAVCVASIGCSGSGVILALSSDVTPIDRVALTVLGPRGAIVSDQEVDPALPGRIAIDAGARRERLRVIAWGSQAGARVAYATTAFDIEPGLERTIAMRLTAPPPDCDGDGIPDDVDGCRAIADPLQQDTDGDGVTDACTPGASCTTNQITNPGFETGTTGWHALSNAVLVQAPDGHSGGFAGNVCKVATGALDLYDIVDRPHVITSTTAGTTYRLDAWVRTTTTAAQQIDPSLKELSGTTQIGDDGGAFVVPTSAWQLVTASYTAQLDGSVLDVRFQGETAADGACFDVDDICLVVQHACP